MRCVMENDDDPFLAFVEFARHNLTEAPPTTSQSHHHPKIKEDSAGPSWAWMVSRILACCRAYPSGVTSAILLSELFQAWHETEILEARSKRSVIDMTKLRALSLRRDKMYEQFNFSKMTTIDSIYEKKFVSFDAVLEVMVVDIQLIPGTRSYLVTLGDAWSLNTIDLYLHRRFYDMLDSKGGILRKGRELRLTGCRLRTAFPTGLGQPRLLPTEYLVILLNEEQDDDAMLLGAQFCSDTFSSIELADFLLDSDYCFYSRLEKIGETDIQENNLHSKRQTFVLSDNNGDLLPLVFWDESIILANLFSAGSMIAVERPIVSRDSDCDKQTLGIFLEYGNRTRLYNVPLVHHEEQVTVRPTQSASKPYEDSKLAGSTIHNEENYPLSQVVLHRDAQGYIDFKKYPIQLLIEGLQPETSNATLCGLVTSVNVSCTIDEIPLKSTFMLGIKDSSGAVNVELCFANCWSIGEISGGHTIFISGLRTCHSESGRLSCTWDEREAGASVINISLLPGLLSSPCLHKVMPLTYLSDDRGPFVGHVFKICIGTLNSEELAVRPVHASCGQPVFQNYSRQWICSFCHCYCEEIAQRYSIIISLHDPSRQLTPGIRVACFGQPATDILQTSPEDFCSWPQDEQTMYLCSLEDEVFFVNLAKQVQEVPAADESQTEFDKKIRLLPFRICCALKSS